MDEIPKATWKGAATSIGHAAQAWAETPFPYLLGFGIAVGLIGFAGKWDGHLYNRTGCVQLKELRGEVFKVDTCTGETEKFQVEKVTPK